MNEQESGHEFEPHRYLSAPWRMRYLREGARSTECVFCANYSADDDAGKLILWRDDLVFVMMNLYPYSTGHIMIAPYEHVASPELIDPAIMAHIGELFGPAMRALRRVLNCQGFNTGMNTGATAGAGIADHLHMHIVPRWNGDANFMPIIANVTVMPETLAVTYARLRAELMEELEPDRGIDSLVFSSDGSAVLYGAHNLFDDDREEHGAGLSVMARAERELGFAGVDVSLLGWIGESTLVWRASSSGVPTSSEWLPIDQVSGDLRTLVRSARDLVV